MLNDFATFLKHLRQDLKYFSRVFLLIGIIFESREKLVNLNPWITEIIQFCDYTEVYLEFNKHL